MVGFICEWIWSARGSLDSVYSSCSERYMWWTNESNSSEQEVLLFKMEEKCDVIITTVGIFIMSLVYPRDLLTRNNHNKFLTLISIRVERNSKWIEQVSGKISMDEISVKLNKSKMFNNNVLLYNQPQQYKSI
jgi:hypothetical protein